MTASLPPPIQSVFERFATCEYVTIDASGHPIAWPVNPYYATGGPTIDLTTGVGYPKKALDARANPQVALLFSDPEGSDLPDAPMALVQGIASVDDADLEANRLRYEREFTARFPAAASKLPPRPVRGMFAWYFHRIYVNVRPERVFAWPGAAIEREPELYGSHMEEVRSGHDEEPAAGHADPEGGRIPWDERLDELGAKFPTAALALVAPDGFPFAVRVAVAADRSAGVVHIGGAPVGVPWQPGLACLTAHAHAPDMTWQVNFQVRGDLVRDGDAWALVPHRIVGGFELPPSRLAMVRSNYGKARRFARVARDRLGGANR